MDLSDLLDPKDPSLWTSGLFKSGGTCLVGPLVPAPSAVVRGLGL
jgi:hypothetical protein